MENVEEVQILPLKSASDGCENHVSSSADKPQQQQSSQAKPSSSKRLLALACLLLLIAVITIVILLGLLASRSCDNGASESDGLQSRRSPKSLTRAVYLDESGKACQHQDIRLPKSLLPTSYQLLVRPVLPSQGQKTSVNFGRVKMMLNCSRPTDAIIFHIGASIRISDLTVTAAQRLDEVSRQRCPSLDLLYIRVSRQCTTGELLNVSLSFEREIEGDKLDGFYMAKYKDKNRALRYMASTHMEPVSARKAFPCFDEPEMKATFDLEVIRDWRYKSLFNMPLARTVPDTRCSHLTNQSGCHRDIFQTSVVMSTYLVAYAVLPMDYVSLQKVVKTSRGSIQVGIWAPSSSQNQLDFAMSVTEKVLPYFEDLFNLSYPLPKLDMIGVPQFAAGAMENWGLIIYRFSTLLYDPNYTTTIDKQTIAEVISHEIAHQWFGNIVTMKWWDELWLNEAFAVFTQYIGVDTFKPGWSMMDRCYVEFVASALQTDSLLHSHPIIVPGLSDPNEIESMFDDISYFKGSALIRMLDAVIGRRTLKRGLIIYLNRFAWRNAASSDLFAAFSEAYMLENGDSGPHANSPVRNLTRVMDTWTTQVNYPLVTVRIRGNKLHFRQERFLLVPNATSIWKSNQTSRFGFRWIVPIRYVTDQISEPRWVWMDLEEEKTIELDHEPKFVKINFNQTGLYRCSYEQSNWRELIRLSREGYFDSTDVAGLLNDAFTLAYINRLNISVPIELFETLQDDHLSSATPWSIAMHKISEIGPMIAGDQQAMTDLSKFIVKILNRPLRNIISKKEAQLTHMERIKRQTLNQIAVMVDEPLVTNKLFKMYQQWRANTSFPLPPDEIELIYEIGVYKGNTSDWQFFKNRLNEIESYSEAKHVCSALAMSSDVDTNYRLIQSLLNLNSQEAFSIAAKLCRRSGLRELVWSYFERNWDIMMERYDMAFTLTEVTKFPAEFHTEYDYQRLSSFFANRDLQSGWRSAYQSLESVKANINWIAHNLDDFKSFIRQKASGL
ncbi:hypothetical protein BOX15_Mlig006138g1 [Macrostomum lignano]|uniref:Aminopeptidase n=1 Tax=Macrostomum lignano TaxID=282301 RepID=A0A267EN91_9PLAT|nr:hypothetical protein BOX15_Mlig006138g1 [Macrostomum lignano]